MKNSKRKTGKENVYVDHTNSWLSEKMFLAGQRWNGFKSKHLLMTYTVMLVPHANSKPVNLKMPVGIIIGIVLAVLVLLGCTTYFAYQSYNLHRVAVENTGLKKISAEQAQQLETLTDKSDEIMDQLADLYSKDNEFRRLLNMEIDNKGKGGVPGSMSTDDVSSELSDKIYSGDPNLQEDLQKLYASLNKLSKYANETEKSYTSIETAVKAKYEKDLCLPTRWPVKGGSISSYFGGRSNPFGGYGSEYHDAIDITAYFGAPIYASGKGVVVSADYNSGYGRSILVDHGYGYQSRYSHCSKLLVKPGDKVKPGQKIAEMGSTGRSTGTHLDFQIIVNGKTIDPLKMLK